MLGPKQTGFLNTLGLVLMGQSSQILSSSTQLNPTKHIQKCLGIWLSFQHYRVYLGDEIQLEVQLEKISKCH